MVGAVMGRLSRVRRAFLDASKRRPLRYVAKPVYEGLVRAELSAIRGFDRFDATPCDVSDLTAIIKTFDRPYALRRLLGSLWRAHAGVAVIIADDGSKHAEIHDPRAKVLRLPYDVGVAEGRNRALAEVRTTFVLQLDDDFVWTRFSGLERVLSTMREHRELDIVGGQCLTLPTFRKLVYTSDRREFGGVEGRPDTVGGLPIYDRLANFFVGRTDRVASVGWDSRLKRVEHSDFFLRALGKLLLAFDERFVCFHAMTPFDEEYMRSRTDIAKDIAYLRMKWAEPTAKLQRPPPAPGASDAQ
jgi:glycosyltransferase involved in cell wall biosynthesis